MTSGEANRVAKEWDIEDRGKGCRLCATPFREGEEVVSAVFPKADWFARRDYCTRCYERHAFRPFSHWRAPALAPKPHVRPTTDRVLAFFEKVAASDVPEHARMAYLLSLWLLRKRALVLRGIEESSEGGRIRESTSRRSKRWRRNSSPFSLSRSQAHPPTRSRRERAGLPPLAARKKIFLDH
jgi:hypothetical protein